MTNGQQGQRLQRVPLRGPTFRLVGEATFLTTKLSVGAAFWRNSTAYLGLPVLQHSPDHLGLFDPSETRIEALELIAEALVVDSQTVENSGIHVIDVHRVTGDIVTKIVGGSVYVSTLHPSARHPDAATASVVVATVAAAPLRV